MKNLLDMHTHTVASGHAYSTIQEMAAAAGACGLEFLGITEHAPKMPGTCQEIYFNNLKVVPRYLSGVRLLLGSELNLIADGSVDLPESILEVMDINIASMHWPFMPHISEEETTKAVIAAMENPYVNIIGHPDDGRYPLDYERVVKAAKETHTLLEVNNNSLNPAGFRPNARENDQKMLELCKLYEVPVILDSDAHFSAAVGQLPYALPLIEEVGFPEHLIANAHPELLWQCLRHKKNRSGFLKNVLDTNEG